MCTKLELEKFSKSNAQCKKLDVDRISTSGTTCTKSDVDPFCRSNALSKKFDVERISICNATCNKLDVEMLVPVRAYVTGYRRSIPSESFLFLSLVFRIRILDASDPILSLFIR